MSKEKKQTKITKAFKQKESIKVKRAVGNNADIEREVEELKRVLEEKKALLFEIKRRTNKRKRVVKEKDAKIKFIGPSKIALEAKERQFEEQLFLYSILTGVEVNVWNKDERCCILYHIMSHNSDYRVRHALNINMTGETNTISEYSLPIGIDLKEIIKPFNDVMEDECIMSVQRALLAYYNRIQQCDSLQLNLPFDATLFKTPDACDLEITLKLVSAKKPNDEPLKVMLNLIYGVEHIRPIEIEIVGKEVTSEIKSALLDQCGVFKVLPLSQAVTRSFLSTDSGEYQCLQKRKVDKSRCQHKKGTCTCSERNSTVLDDDNGYSTDTNDSENHSLDLALLHSSRVVKRSHTKEPE